MNDADPRLETLFTPAMALSSGFDPLESAQPDLSLYWRVMPGQRPHYVITYRHVVTTLTTSRKLAESLVRPRGRQLDT